MTRPLAEGEIVDVTIRGARVTNVFTSSDLTTGEPVIRTMVAFRYTGDAHRAACVPVDAEAVIITRVAPPLWPPQPGDIWATGQGRVPGSEIQDVDPEAAELWSCVRNLDTDEGTDDLLLIPVVGDRQYCITEPDELARRVPLRLVYRLPAGGAE